MRFAASILVLSIVAALASPLAVASRDRDGDNERTDADGQIPRPAAKAYHDGRFILAATLCESYGGAEALAFAARARIADAVTREDSSCFDCLLKAEAVAHEAIKRDATLADAYVQLAVAIGFRGRLLSPFDAQSEGLPEKGRKAIDKALALDPTNNWARATLGAWHLEIVHRAGPVLAFTLYGASETLGVETFRQALAVEPDSLLLHFHFALSVLALDVNDFREEAQNVLGRGLSDPRSDALTGIMRRHARELRDLLEHGGEEEIARLVRGLQGYPRELEPAVAKQN